MFTIEKACQAQAANAERAAASPWKPLWHLSAPSGWINDPNGIIFYQGRLHVYYQHNPYSADWETMHWGHASSEDMLHWQHHPVALAPDTDYEGACYSGSAMETEDGLAVVYTGNRRGNPIKEVQCLAISKDSITFEKPVNAPIIPKPPEGVGKDFRDPYLFKRDGRTFFVLGASRDGKGCALLYEMNTLTDWTYRGVMYDGDFGTMWECPCLAQVDGRDVLIFSPMGLEGHKNVALIGAFDPDSGRFTMESWQEIDLGPDFYAAQAAQRGDEAWMIAWMNSWGSEGSEHLEKADGWCGCMTLPRQMHIRDGRLTQFPPESVKELPEYGEIENRFRHVAEQDKFTLRLMDGERELFSVTREGGKLTFRANGKETTVQADCGVQLILDGCALECYALDGSCAYSVRVYPKGAVILSVE